MTLEQIGQKLKTAREGQGLSLGQINERTKIPINHLQSIDSGVADDLPETVYVAGFIKRYADCVGLNGPSLSDEYRREASSGNGSNGDAAWPPRSTKAAPTMVSPAYTQRVRTEEKQPNVFRTLLWPALWIVLLIPIVGVLLQLYQNNNNNQQDTTINNLRESSSKFNQVQPSAIPNSPTQAGPTTTAAVPTAVTPPVSTEAEISVSASHHVWVDIKAVSTGETMYSGFLEAGDQRVWKDSQGVRVHAGNGGSLTIVQDGKSQTLGPAGKIAEKVFASKNPNPAAVAADGTKPGTIPGTGTGTATAVKPTVKRPVKKPLTGDAAATPRKRYRSLDDMPSRQYIPGESVGGTRSIDVPYRYTEGGRLDSE